MGAVFSLPCFRRQRRRPCPTSTSAPPSTRTIAISHPRPLGSVLPVSSSVNSTGPNGTGGLASAARSIVSDAGSTAQSQSGKDGRRGFIGIGFTQFVTLGLIEDSASQTTTWSPTKRSLELTDLGSGNGSGSEDTHVSSTLSTGENPFSGPRTSTRPRGASATSSCAILHRDPSQSATSCSSGSGSGDESLRRIAARNSSTRSRAGHAQKRANSYARSSTKSRTGRSRPRSYPATNVTSNGSRNDAGGIGINISSSTDHNMSAMSPTARRRALRKIRRVNNGWDYIQPVDLDGFDEKLGTNGKRMSLRV